ncbi:MAG: hypothetical protein JJT94_11685, partial [Bernardetiaceae bacterium]|nr:hypothetical protein [Bernardetiaceae bacterium]
MSKHIKTFALLLIICNSVFLILYPYIPARFAVNDDVVMLLISSGKITGEPEPYLIFINFLIGYILSQAYTYLPSVEWYSVHHVMCYASSLAVLLFVFIQQKENRVIKSLKIITVLLFIVLFALELQFTTVAFSLSIAGYLLAYYTITNYQFPDKLYIFFGIIAVLFILWGFCVRFEAWAVTSLLVVPFFYKSLAIKKNYLLYGTAALLLIFAFSVDKIQHQGDDWEYFTEYNKLRGKLNRYDNRQILDSQLDVNFVIDKHPHVTKEDVKLFTWYVYPTSSMNLEVIQSMRKATPAIPIIKAIKDFLYTLIYYFPHYSIPISITALVALFFAIKNKIFIELLFSIFLLLCSLFFLISTANIIKDRVFIGMIVSIVIFLFSTYSLEDLGNNRVKQKKILHIGTVMIL